MELKEESSSYIPIDLKQTDKDQESTSKGSSPDSTRHRRTSSTFTLSDYMNESGVIESNTVNTSPPCIDKPKRVSFFRNKFKNVWKREKKELSSFDQPITMNIINPAMVKACIVIQQEGWLEARVGEERKWKTRWVVFKDNAVYIFKSKDDNELLNMVSVQPYCSFLY